MTRKLISLVLAIALLLCTCSVSALAEAAQEPMHITWIGGQLTSLDEDARMIKYWNELFNVDIEVMNLDSASANEQLSMWFAAGNIPDVMVRGFKLNAMDGYVKQDLLAELPYELLEQYMPNTLAQLDENAPGWQEICKIDGKLYGLPQTFSVHNMFRYPIVYNGIWMEKVGVDKVPTTIDEFEELMYKFTNEDPDGNGQNDTYGLSQSGMEAVYGAFGYIPKQWKVKDGQMIYSSVQPEMKDALAKLAKWYADGVLSPDFITGENFGGYWAISNAFTEGQIGFTGHGNYYHWHGDIGIGENHNPAAMEAVLGKEAMEAITFGNPLSGPYGEGVIVQKAPFDGTQIAFGVQLEEQPEKLIKILEMIEYISGGDIENYFTAKLGVKGETWDYDANGVPTLFEEYAGSGNQNALSAMGAHTLIAPITFLRHSELVYQPRFVWGTANGFDQGKGSWSELFTTLPSSGEYTAELDKIEDEAYIDIITGKKPIEYFDTFVAEWMSAGGEILVAEANEWYANR